MGRSKTSLIYTYFGLIEDGQTTCKYEDCRRVIKCPSATNLKKHLVRFHLESFKDFQERSKEIGGSDFYRNKKRSDSKPVSKSLRKRSKGKVNYLEDEDSDTGEF